MNRYLLLSFLVQGFNLLSMANPYSIEVLQGHEAFAAVRECVDQGAKNAYLEQLLQEAYALENKESAPTLAQWQSHLVGIAAAIDAGASVNSYISPGSTRHNVINSLGLAVALNDIPLAEFLLQSGALVNNLSFNHQSALYYVCSAGMLKLLFNKQAGYQDLYERIIFNQPPRSELRVAERGESYYAPETGPMYELLEQRSACFLVVHKYDVDPLQTVALRLTEFCDGATHDSLKRMIAVLIRNGLNPDRKSSGYWHSPLASLGFTDNKFRDKTAADLARDNFNELRLKIGIDNIKPLLAVTGYFLEILERAPRISKKYPAVY